MTHRARIAATLVTVAVGVQSAAADREIVIETPGERSAGNKALLAGLAGASVVAGSIGLYFHLDSRATSNEVSAATFTGEAWTTTRQDQVDQAARSRTRAAVAYGLGGALLIGTIVALIVSEPPTTTEVIRPGAAPTIAPVPGGAVLGGAWSF